MENENKIINMTICAHVDSGKTTLSEKILYLSGEIRSAGSVDSGTAHTDTLSVERKRGISVKSAHASFIRNGIKVNLIDTPGHADFSFEVDRTLSVSDALVLVVSSVEGIQAQSECIYHSAEKLKIPTIVFINKTDRSLSDASKVFGDLCENFNGNFVLFNRPENERSASCFISKVPDLTETLVDILSNFDDSIAEKAIYSEVITEREINDSVRKNVINRNIIPVFCGSAAYSVGIEELLDGIISYFPLSTEVYNTDSAVIFGIENDKSFGRKSLVRTYSKCLSVRDSLSYNDGREDEKISRIKTFSGTKSFDTGILPAGDIGEIYGLQNAKIFDSFGGKFERISNIANPFLNVKVTSDSADPSKLLSAFKELESEDPLLSVKWESAEKEVVISITGKMQTEILSFLVKERYGYDVSFSEPTVIYKETPSSSAYGFEAYTMPKPCWAVVKLLIEPLPTGSGILFDMGNVPHNKLFYKYQEHIKRSFFETLEQGIMGWEVTDLKATLVDGEHHTIHTHPLDFFVATPMATMNALKSAGSTLLEPMLNVRITAPSEYSGRILTDISKMRGEFSSPVMRKDVSVIECTIPVSDSLEYPIELAKMTSGKAVYSAIFAGYRKLPGTVITTKRRGIDPLDRAKWILYKRGAITEGI